MKSVSSSILSISDVLQHHDVCVYLETENDWVHVGQFVEKLLEHTQVGICILCSEFVTFESELIGRFPDRVKFFNIGAGFFRSLIFPQLSAEVFVMTLTDLGSARLRKSPNVQNYLYIFHSITSTHMCYTAEAFDDYDTIFCVGPHQGTEIRKRENLCNLRQKRLVDFGHASIERLRTFAENLSDSRDPKRIAIAPSWGPTSLIETLPAEFYLRLLDAGYSLYVRLHSMSIKRKKYFAADIESIAKSYPQMDLDYSHLDMQALAECSTMVSDWSGAATEFSFGFRRPVIFINTPRKVRNADYEKLELLPLEVRIRDKIGELVEVEDANHISTWLPEFLSDKHFTKMDELIDREYHATLFSTEPSWVNGLKALQDLHGSPFTFSLN